MTPTMRIDTVSSRRNALAGLNPMVCAELARAACRWAMTADFSIELTAYDQVYHRMPEIGGHWTLFSARLGETGHEASTVSVAVEFEDERPVDLHISGVHEVIAGACTAVALREALQQCGGPLRHLTPLCLGLPRDTKPVAASPARTALSV
jgi:hypothetical protein